MMKGDRKWQISPIYMDEFAASCKHYNRSIEMKMKKMTDHDTIPACRQEVADDHCQRRLRQGREAAATLPETGTPRAV